MFSPMLAALQDDWPPHTVVTGAVTYDAVHGGMPRLLEEFLDAGPAPIVFTLGSTAVVSGNAPRFFQESVDAISDSGVIGVIIIGHSVSHIDDSSGHTE